MELKATYKLVYTINREEKELLVKVNLEQVTGLIKQYQSIWEAKVIVNDKPYLNKDLPLYVNAKLAAEEIGLNLKKELKNNAKLEGKSFRVKKEELK